MSSGSWRTAAFKEYNFDALGSLPPAGHLHPLLKVRAEYRQIFLEMGFTEMPTNNYVESSFWNFDALFVPQKHPARDAQVMCEEQIVQLVHCRTCLRIPTLSIVGHLLRVRPGERQLLSRKVQGEGEQGASRRRLRITGEDQISRSESLCSYLTRANLPVKGLRCLERRGDEEKHLADPHDGCLGQDAVRFGQPRSGLCSVLPQPFDKIR